MAFQAKDGSKHTNHDSMRHADAKFGGKPAMAKAPMPSDNDGDEAQPENDGAAMAQQHGPAVQIDITHNHEAGQHTVHAQHPDGHAHESEHGSAGEAHKFAADCAGGGM